MGVTARPAGAHQLGLWSKPDPTLMQPASDTQRGGGGEFDVKNHPEVDLLMTCPTPRMPIGGGLGCTG